MNYCSDSHCVLYALRFINVLNLLRKTITIIIIIFSPSCLANFLFSFPIDWVMGKKECQPTYIINTSKRWLFVHNGMLDLKPTYIVQNEGQNTNMCLSYVQLCGIPENNPAHPTPWLCFISCSLRTISDLKLYQLHQFNCLLQEDYNYVLSLIKQQHLSSTLTEV